MFANYIKSTLRNFSKNKFFTFLNIAGLALGMASCILILQYVKYERSYDTFHENSDRIYRIQYNNIQNGITTFECAAAVPAVGPELRDNFPEILRFTRLFPVSGVVSYMDPDKGFISFREEKMQITDSSVFVVFDFELLKGNPVTSLAGPNKVVVSESAAKRYFGEKEPIGKRISWNGDNEFEVTGVIKDVPDNSHIKFDFLFSYQTLNNWTDNASETAWGWYDFNTYVLVEDGVDINVLQEKWNNHLAEVRKEDWENRNTIQQFIFQPLLDIHLYSNLLQESEPEEQGDGDAVYFLTIIAFFILIIAWVNYINLSTAKSFERANEVGVRKVMGAQKRQLVKQFLTESFIVNLVALALALILVRLVWPGFGNISGREIPIEYIFQNDFWIITAIFLVGGSVLSGFYPALVLSSFKPVEILKGKAMRSSFGSFMRKGLVVFQFVASVILISGVIIVFQQLSFMKNMDLGIDLNKTLVFEGPGITDSLYQDKLENFRTEALRVPGIVSMTAGTNIPGDEIFWTRGIRRLTGGPENSTTVYNMGIDYDYIEAFDLELIAGRNFSQDFPNDNERVLVNRALAETLEFDDFENAIGQKVQLGGDTLEIAGILENYHQMSLQNKVAPIVFRLFFSSNFYTFKIEGDNYQQVIGQLKEPWETFFAGNPIDYFFLDQFYNRQYDGEKQFSQVFGIFTLLAIFVACLGLFGLASFMTLQRTKEIGIRKALGASIPNIVLLLSNGFVRLVIIANIIAWPLAWILMDSWLQSFPYRININPLLFLVAGMAVILIAILSVSLQTFKAALLSPASTLKYE